MYTLTTKQAAKAAALIIKQAPHADIDYLIDAAMKGLYGVQASIDMHDCMSEHHDDAWNTRGAIEYHVKEKLRG